MKNTTQGPDEVLMFSPEERLISALQKMERLGCERAVIKGSHERFLLKNFLEDALKMGFGSSSVWKFTFSRILYNKKEKKDKDFLKKLHRFFPGFRKVLPYFLKPKGRVFLVGGSVRDLLLSIPPKEIDIMIEGDTMKFSKELAKKTGASIKNIQQTFGTSTLELEGIRIDLARARKDLYPFPCSDPIIKWAKAEEDPLRRDFTINALIFDLKEELLIDVTDGLEDLERSVLTPITPISFYEDPTRLQRGIRLSIRLGFELSEDFLLQMEGVKKDLLLEKLPRERLLAEDKLILEEEKPSLIIKECVKLNIFSHLFPNLPTPSQRAMEDMDRAYSDKESVDRLWYLRLLIWLDEIPYQKREEFVKVFRFGKKISSGLLHPESLKSMSPLIREEEIFIEKFQ